MNSGCSVYKRLNEAWHLPAQQQRRSGPVAVKAAPLTINYTVAARLWHARNTGNA
jgi:hypothetical protein